jgi:hypothetical protein
MQEQRVLYQEGLIYRSASVMSPTVIAIH